MDAPASFGSWLKLRRWTLDLTQDALARQVGCSVVTIRKLESDERRPSRQLAERLADALDIGAHERSRFISLGRAEPTLDATPSPEPLALPTRMHLPLPLTQLIGRRADVAAIKRALLRGATRLLTLAGPPGVGKTHLALHIATEVRPAFPDGVCFVDLAPIRDPDLVLTAIAQALGLREIGDRPLAERLQDYLHGKRLLLLLDNFEQVLAAAPLVVGLLAGGAGLKALITSRAPLHVRGEQVVPVAPLPILDPAQPPAMRALAQNPAVALFVERAQAIQPAFALTEANGAAVAAICARLDGLPLAIELVAARVGVLPLGALLERLDRRLALLTDGPRDLPLRHQTLRAAIAGSYELLDRPAQALFRRLGMFVGGAPLGAIAAVKAGAELREGETETVFLPPDSSALPALLAALVAHSLLGQRPHAEDAPRWTMLETIREYALELLVEAGEATAVQNAHATYFLDLAERAEPELHGPDQVAWLDLLEADNANLRVALDWMLQTGDRERVLRLSGALWWFWSVRGYRSEGRRWLDRILDMVVFDQSNSEQPTAHIARALHAAGHLALLQGDFAAARARLEAGVDIWRGLVTRTSAERHAQQGLVTALTFLILATQFAGDTAAREPLVAEFLTLGDTLDDPRAWAMFLYNRGGWALLQQGNYKEARPQLEQSLALFRPLGDLWHIARVVIDLGLVAMYQEDYEAARTWYTEGLTLAQALKDRELIASALNNLGEVTRCQDDDERAAHLYAESLQLHQDLGNTPETPRLLHNLGYVALHQGDIAQATAYFRESLSLFQQLNMTRGIAENLTGFAAVAASCGRPVEAARLWGAGEALHAMVGTPVWPTDRREHARYQAIARAQLDAASWDAAWQEGRLHPLAQQVALDETARDMTV
jgi:predicted ATPase/transcriptional regulator with XRE-family HTH domain